MLRARVNYPVIVLRYIICSIHLLQVPTQAKLIQYLNLFYSVRLTERKLLDLLILKIVQVV